MKTSAIIGVYIIAIMLGYYLDKFLGVWLAMILAGFIVTFANNGFDKAVEVLKTSFIAFASGLCAGVVCLIAQELANTPLPGYIIFLVFLILFWRFYNLLKIKESNCQCKNKH